MRQQPEESRTQQLRKALAAKNNFIVAKAADLVRDFNLIALTPDLVTAYERFFENPEKSDPQCWAKNAISKTLATFEYQEPDAFLRGMRHVQSTIRSRFNSAFSSVYSPPGEILSRSMRAILRLGAFHAERVLHSSPLSHGRLQ